MLDRLGNEVDFTELFMEETLSAKDRKELPDSMYGIVYTDENGKKVRKYPLNDEKHVLQAVRFFNKAPEEHKPELARKIVKRAKELDMDYSGWEVLKPYLNGGKKKVVKESFGPELPDSTSGTSDFDESSTSSEDDVFNETFGEVMEKNLQDRMIKSNDLLPVRKPNSDEVYFASDVNYMPEIDLDRPLFVTPYKDLASIFAGRNALRSRLRGLNYNLEYEEWLNFNERKEHNPLKVVHVYVEGVPDLDPFVLEAEGYIHCILTRDYEDNFFRYHWMNDLEYLIAKTDNMKVQFFRQIKCKVKYIVEGRPWKVDADKTLGRPDRLPSRLQIAKNIAKDIHEYVEKKSKEPTGNQNCLLCTWCAEAQFRGRTVLPRPVYSPRDMIFKYTNVECVKGGEKKRPRGFDNLMELLQDAGDGDHRWYCHVDWNEGNGGHEFLILKIDGKYHVMDTQQGEVGPLTSAHKYFDDVAWKGTFIVRLNNKPFDFDLLKQVNDPANTLPWDPDKDIPYMVKHGMMTKEEAKKELKHAETMEFYKELKKELGQTPVQEGATEDPMSLLPKDLQEWLKKGDFSKLEKDDSYYYIEGHPVEEFWRDPEFARSAFYLDDKNDPSYNSIVFSDDNGNGLIYDPTDGWYYYLYHDWTEDDTGFLHRERLSSKSWSIIVDPTHIKKFKDQQEKSRIASEELRDLKSSRIYSDISHASNKYFGKGIFKSDLKEVLSRWYKIGLDWCNDVIDFAEKYDFPKLKEAIEYFENHSIPEFSPSIADAHGLNVEAYREGATKVVAAFNDVEDKLRLTPIQESALPDGVFLRPATLKDVPTMRDWQLESINARLRKRPDMIEYMEKDARESVPDTKMIMSGDRTIGMLQCCWIDDGEWWYIGEIYLIAEFRGRGIGSTLLLNEISEHDKLRLQVATDNPRAKALYESLGFKTVRMNQDMEVMDLVKTPESVCENMVEQLKSFKYGLGSNGSVHSASSKEYDEKYRLESPEEFEENGGGICYDYVEFMDKYLKEYGYHCRKFYISTDTEDNDTHTFILVNDGKGGYVYPESAFKLLEGVHHVKSPEDAALKVMDKVFDINDNGKKYDEIKYYVWEYEGHPPYGSTMEECGKYFTKGEPFHEGTAMKIK